MNEYTKRRKKRAILQNIYKMKCRRFYPFNSLKADTSCFITLFCCMLNESIEKKYSFFRMYIKIPKLTFVCFVRASSNASKRLTANMLSCKMIWKSIKFKIIYLIESIEIISKERNSNKAKQAEKRRKNHRKLHAHFHLTLGSVYPCHFSISKLHFNMDFKLWSRYERSK